MDALQRLRDTLGAPLIVTSGYRSPAHNRAEGGKPGSRHLVGEAFDVSMANHDPRAFYEAAIRAGFKAFGHYPRRSEEHTSELQSLMRISYAVFCLKKKTQQQPQ